MKADIFVSGVGEIVSGLRIHGFDGSDRPGARKNSVLFVSVNNFD